MAGRLRTRVLATLLVVAAGWAPAAGAELFRCVAADGSITFTDKAGACPHSTPHVPLGVVQSMPGATPARPATRTEPDAALAAEARAGLEQQWRDKKRGAEKELAALEERRDYLDQFLTHCRRGGQLLRTDEAGLRHKVSCAEVDEEWDALARRKAELEAYLSGGLEEECRRAGCLPGWVR